MNSNRRLERPVDLECLKYVSRSTFSHPTNVDIQIPHKVHSNQNLTKAEKENSKI